MEKKKLLECRLLNSTKEFHALVEADGEKDGKKIPCYDAFIRAEEEDGLLRVFVFSRKQISAGVETPAYLIFASKKEDNFLTYDLGQGKWRYAMLFHLGLSKKGRYYTEIYTPKKEEHLLQKYFDTKDSGAYAIYAFQRAVRERKQIKRDKKKTDVWDKKMEEVPKLPKDWEKWVQKEGTEEHFMFYNYQKGGAKEGYCSHCKKTVPIRSPKYNAEGTCPRCRQKIQYKSIKKFGKIWTEYRQVQLLQRCQSGLLLRLFKTRTVYRAETYQHPKVLCWETERIFFGSRWEVEHYYYGDFKKRGSRWIQGYQPYSWGYSMPYQGKTYKRTLPSLEKGILKKTGLPEMIRQFETDPETYLKTLAEHPCLEQIVKAGLYALAGELLGYNSGWYGVRIDQAESLTDILRIDKGRIRRLREMQGGKKALAWLQREQEENTWYPEALIEWFIEKRFIPDDFRFVQGQMSSQQIKNYLIRQAMQMGEEIKRVHTVWRDYLSMAKRLEMDVTDAVVYRTPKLSLRHQQLIERIEEKAMRERIGEIEALYPKIAGVYQGILGKYQYQDREYAIIVPKNAADIVREGTALHHCVDKGGSYFERIEDQETYILFLRRSQKIATPYYTLEVEPGGAVRQLRTEYDRQDNEIPKIREFLCRWQEVIRKKMTEEDWALAERSRGKREGELEKLREEEVMIWDGNQRRLLAEVLEEDLLEPTEPIQAEAA